MRILYEFLRFYPERSHWGLNPETFRLELCADAIVSAPARRSNLVSGGAQPVQRKSAAARRWSPKNVLQRFLKKITNSFYPQNLLMIIFSYRSDKLHENNSTEKFSKKTPLSDIYFYDFGVIIILYLKNDYGSSMIFHSAE